MGFDFDLFETLSNVREMNQEDTHNTKGYFIRDKQENDLRVCQSAEESLFPILAKIQALLVPEVEQ